MAVVRVPVQKQVDMILDRLAPVVENFRWFLESGYKVRTKVDGQIICPLFALGYQYSNSNNKYIPSLDNLKQLLNTTDQALAAAIHIIDDIRSSRYFDNELRNRLLTLCGLVEVVEEELITAE